MSLSQVRGQWKLAWPTGATTLALKRPLLHTCLLPADKVRRADLTADELKVVAKARRPRSLRQGWIDSQEILAQTSSTILPTTLAHTAAFA